MEYWRRGGPGSMEPVAKRKTHFSKRIDHMKNSVLVLRRRAPFSSSGSTRCPGKPRRVAGFILLLEPDTSLRAMSPLHCSNTPVLRSSSE